MSRRKMAAAEPMRERAPALDLRHYADLCEEQAQILRNTHDTTVALLRQVGVAGPDERPGRMSTLATHFNELARIGLSACVRVSEALENRRPATKYGSAAPPFGVEAALRVWADVVTARMLGQVQADPNASVKAAYHSVVHIFEAEAWDAWQTRTHTMVHYVAPYDSLLERDRLWAPCTRELDKPGEPGTAARRPGKLVDLPSEIAGLAAVVTRLRDQADLLDPGKSMGRRQAGPEEWKPTTAYTSTLPDGTAARTARPSAGGGVRHPRQLTSRPLHGPIKRGG